MGTAYICLILCTSELTSALPFAGGAYGIARCTIGFFPGFLVGCSEALEYITYVSLSTLALGSMICELLGCNSNVEPFIWFLFYASALVIHIKGGIIFWRFSHILGLISLGVLLLYCFSCLSIVNFNKNAVYSTNNGEVLYFVDGFKGFMLSFPLSAWFYVGSESLAFACDVVEDARKDIPHGSLASIVTLFITSILVLFICCSSPPGVTTLAKELSPFDFGFAESLHFPKRYALIFVLPATYATAFGFIFSYGKLLQSLALSKLVPSPLATATEFGKTPYVAILFGSGLGFGICTLVHAVPWIGSQLFNICILSAFLAYISQCIGYVIFKLNFVSIERKFINPLGIFAAIYAGLVFSLGVIAIIGFQEDHQFALITYLCLCVMLSVYYFTSVKDTQGFSPDEQKIMFRAHVILFNSSRRRRVNRSNRSNNNIMNSSSRQKTSSRVVDNNGGQTAKLSTASSVKIGCITEDGNAIEMTS
jgi:amino acid transporter